MRALSATVEYTPGSNPVQDGSGLDALPLAGEEVDIRDETPPEPASGTVPASGAVLFLIFNEDLDIAADRLPPADAFTVKADGAPVTVQSVVASSSDTLLLTLSSTIKQGRTVTVDYTVPTTNPLRDVGGNETDGFPEFPVTNNSTVATVEEIPPEPASGTVPPGGSSLTLTFTEDLDIAADSLPPASAFTVMADGDTVTVESVALGTDPDRLVFHLPTDAIKQGRTVTVDYAVPTTNPIRDVAGNEAAAFAGFAVDNNSTVDGIPPVPASGAVVPQGDTLTLTFNEDLGGDQFMVPPASAFTVKVDGVTVTVQSVIAPTVGTLNMLLSSAIKQGRTVTVDYAVPATNPIRDVAGNEAAAFTGFAVDNNSTVDGIPPELARARVSSSGGELYLHFNEDLDVGAGDPPAEAFTVKADGVEVAASEVLRSADGFNVLLLQLPAAAIGQHQVVTVSYAVPATGPVIADVAGNEALPFIDEPVTNNSTVANTTPPVLTRARVSSSGDQLYLDFNEDLDVGAGDPPADAFTVKADGVEVAASEVLRSADGFNVLFLQLPTAAIKQDQTVTVSYAVPESGPVIADTDGNEAKAFDDFAVTNNSTVDATPPELERASVFASGDQLLLYFNEDLDIGPGELPPADAFTVKADGVEVAVSEVFLSTSGFHVLILQLPAGAIGRGHTVTVSYAVPTTGTVIADVAGNEALAFTDERVTNNSTAFVMDATGTPTISGVPQVGNTLRADISGIEDDDGLPATLTYRWVRVVAAGLETAVGTDSSYTVSSADVGFTIRVEVSFTDGAGNPEGPLASDAVGPAVAAAGACPAGSDWRATMTMGYRVNEFGSSRFHEFGFTSNIGALDPATIPYATGYPVTRLAHFLTTSLDGNTTHTDSVRFTVSGGELPDGTVLNLGATVLTVGTDSHSGTAGQEQWDLQTLGISLDWVGGQELTVCANLAPVLESARADGTSLVLTYAEPLDTGSTPAPGAYAVTVDGGAGPAVSDVSVSGRTVTLTLAAAVTAANSVTLTYTPGSNPVQDGSGLDAPGFGDETVVVNNDATGAPTISGVAQVGGMLTADVSAIRDLDGLPSGFDYRWVRIASGGGKTDIGTNMSRYSPTYADVGSTIGVEVSFTDGKGYPEGPLASVATAAVTAPTTTGTCPADSDWRATLTMGYLSETLTDVLIQRFGYDVDTTDFGALDLVTIPYAPDYTVTKITRNLLTLLDGNTIDQDSLNFTVTGGDLPDGTVLNFGATVLTVDTDSATLTAGQEHWSLLALGLSPTWAEDQELTVCANLPPGLESAEVEGTSLDLTYTEPLDARSVPLPGAYSVTVDGTAAAPSSVSVSGKTVTLTLAEAVTAGRSATVEYTPGSNPVQDGSGLDALTLTGEEVDIRDETAPEPASGTVPPGGSSLSLTFTEDLDIAADRVPPASAFTVKADGVPVTVQSVVGSSLDTLSLTLSSTIKQGRTVTVDYTVPGDDDNPLQDVGGNRTGEFTGFAVDNNSTVEGIPPEPASGTVPGAGNTLTLIFNEDLDLAADSLPPASAFTVKADGDTVTVQSVALGTDPDQLVFDLGTGAIKQDRTVTVDYAVPATNPIRDAAGNEAAAFTDFAVDNNSTVEGIPPEPASGAVQGSGDRLSLTFNEDLDIAAVPPASAFTVKADGVEVAVQSVAASFSDTLALRLSATIGARQIVTVSYAVPTTGTVIEDTAGNEAVGFEDFPVTNNSTVANTTPPVPASGEVGALGDTLTLTFNEDLDIAAVPFRSAFTVKADGVEVPGASVFTRPQASDQLALELSAPIGARQIVTVSYAVPTTGGVIEDLAGNDAVAFEDFPVTNNSTVANTTPPVPLSGVVPASGASLTLTFNEDLDIAADSLPPPGAFMVKVKAAGADDDDVTVESVALGTGPDRFVLTLPDDAIKQCHTVTVDYTVPATNPLQDTDDNDAEGFTGFPVTNNSTVECPSLNPPVFPPPDPRMFTVKENTPGGTAIDGPVTATDADGDTLTYSLLRTVDVPFATHFTIDAATGQLRNKKALDYEAGGTSRPNRMGIIVVADDGRGRTAQITVVVDVIDMPEPPGPPGDLTVEGSGTTSLLVTWTTPPNEGRPDIETYDVQYREAGAGPWTDGPQDVTGTEAIVRPVDAGKSYDVQVRATNDEGDGDWAIWGGDGAVPVTIEARFARIGGGLEDLDFTLTRQGDTTDELVATVTIVQDQSWLGDSDLEHEVIFEAGEATADLTIAATKFSFAPITAGGLTATVSGDGISGGEDTVQIVSTAAPPITVSLDMSAYTFAEADPAEDTAIYLVATLHRDYPEPPAPARAFDIAVSTESGTATFREDFVAIATVVDFLAGDYALVDGQYVARKNIGFAVVDDQVYEGSEDLVVKLEASPRLNRELVQILMPDGTAGDRYPVTVTDGGDVPVLSLSVDRSPIAEEDDDATPAVAENVSTVTVGITNGKTFAEDRTVTLTFSGATRGTHYSVSPADTDTNAAGHQAALPAGDSSVEVTVTAAANDAAGGNRTLTVAGEFDGKVIGRRTITILDDDTTTANTDAEGAPEIGGTPQVGDELNAGIGTIADDTDGLPATFPVDYDFQWLRVDTANVETPVGRNLDIYRPVPADVGSRIKVEVRFTDVAGNPEGPLASAAVGPVEPAAVCAVDLGGRTQIWTGDVTVGVLDAGGNPLLYGFGTGFGALDDTQFRVDPNGNGYTVDGAVVDASGTTTPGRLQFSLTGALAPPDLAQLTLHVCGDSFALADATVSSTEHSYSWNSAGLDWSSVTSRTLYLSVPTKTAPVVDNPLADQVATPGTAFTYRVPADTFSDADGDALTYSATRDDGTALPSWLEFDDASRIFSGTPAVADIETVAVKVTASDGRGGTVSDTFDIAVALEACVLGGDVWCATLVVQNLGSGQRGCANGQTGKECSNPSRLTEDEFRHDGTDYDVTTVQVRTDGELRLWLSDNLTAETGSLVLVVGSERFPFAGADEKNADNRRWAGSGLSWSTGDTVGLRLVEGFQPLAPAAPRVNGVDDNDTSLKVTWGAPDNAGRPPIAHYDLRYRESGSGDAGWREWPDDETATNATIADLTMGTEYDVQVRASNADGDGPWSPSGQGTPGVTAKNGDLQLVDKDGNDVTETTGKGRLEVRLKGQWGTVCNDRFTSAFDNPNDDLEPDPGNNEDAKVPNVAALFACQQMGKKTGEMISRPTGFPVLPNVRKGEPGYVPIWLDDVRCAGTVGDDGMLEMANHWRGSKATTKLNHCYHAGVGLHNCNHGEDVHLQCTGDLSENATQEEEAAALTASFEDLPETHDGATPFTFRLSLSADIANGDADMHDSAFEVTGGSVTGVGRVDGRSDLWEITVTPDGTGNIGIVLAANRECGTAGALCTADGRMLTTALLGSVTAQPGTGTGTTATDEEGAAALTAQFVDVPAEHDGASKFRFRLVFSDEIFDGTEPVNKNKAVRDALAVTGGVAKGSSRVDKTEFDAYWIDVRPSGNGPVTISLSPAASCGPSSVTCTPDGRKLSAAIGARVEGPAGLSVADATVLEGPGAALAFAVTLDRSTSADVQVDYATRDGTAQAGSDYTAASGTLNFAPGETAKTVTVAVLDDAHDEGSETLTLVLSNPSGAYLADGEATGTIENSDLMPQAWLSRFGRTVAEQVLEAVEERIRAAPQAGVQVTVAGQRIGAAQAPSEEEAREAEAQARLEDFSTWLRGEACRDDPGAGGDCPARTRSREVTPRDLLTGSSFALTTGAEGIGGGLVSLWGRGAVSSFDGREGDLSLSGEVTGALLGADWTRDPGSGSGAGGWTTGLMMSHARGEGSYRGANSGKVSSTVTGLYPYGRYAVTDRVTVWGAAGYGVGTLTLTPEDGESTYEADMDLAMAAAGLRGVVVEAPPEGGPELAVKTDAMGVRTSSEATGGSAGGNLAAATADVTRLRLGLEGTWRGLEIGTGTLSPRLEIGVRHDGGDAETGFGLDLGGGLAWSDPGTGIRAEVSGRGLLTHESAGFRERGIAGSFGWDPTPGSDRGPSLTLSQTMGVSARGGADALLGRTTLAGLAANDNGDELERRRLELKLGYGFGAFGDGFTSTPEVGFGMSAGQRDYSLAWRLVRDRRRGDLGSLEFSLETRRRESANDDTPPEHTVGLRLTARW